MKTLLDVTTHYHRALDEYLWCHQEALLEQDLPLAREWFALFREVFEAHIRQEDAVLLPRCEALGLAGQWPLLVYRKEHEKIAGLLDRTSAMLEQLPGGHHAMPRRNILQLLDYQRTLKNVIEHHEEREEKGLLPELDAALDPGERERLALDCAAVWSACEARVATRRNELLGRLTPARG